MTPSLEEKHSKKSLIPRGALSETFDWFTSTLFVVLLFAATLSFFGIFTEPLGFGGLIHHRVTTLADWLSVDVLKTDSTQLDKGAAVFLLIVLALSMAMVSCAQDKRVSLIAVSAIVGTASLIWFTAFGLNWLGYGIASFSMITIAALALSFIFRPAKIVQPSFSRSFRRKFVFVYWSVVVILCAFQIMSTLGNEFVNQSDADDIATLIGVFAIVFFMGIYLFASLLTFLQILLWSGLAKAETLSLTNFAQLLADPVPPIFDASANPLGNTLALALILVFWMGLSACSLAGAIKNKKYAWMHTIGIGTALLLILVSGDLSEFGSGLLGLFDFSSPETTPS